MTPEERAREVISQHAATTSVGWEYLIATAIREAEERGRVQEREECAMIADNAEQQCKQASEEADANWEFELANAWQCRMIAKQIRACSTAPKHETAKKKK